MIHVWHVKAPLEWAERRDSASVHTTGSVLVPSPPEMNHPVLGSTCGARVLGLPHPEASQGDAHPLDNDRGGNE